MRAPLAHFFALLVAAALVTAPQVTRAADDLAAKTADNTAFKFRAFDLGSSVFLPAHAILDPAGAPFSNTNPLVTSLRDAVVPAGSPFTAAATGVVFSADTLGSQSASIQIVGTFVQTFVVEASNDNSNWVSQVGYAPTNTGSLAPSATITAAGIVNVPVTSRYIRLRSTAYTSGTATVSAVLRAAPLDAIGVYVAAGSVTASLSTGTSSIGSLSAISASGGIASISRIASSAASTNLTQAKSTTARLYKAYACNTTTSPIRIKFYNATSASVTVGTTAPFLVRTIPGATGAGAVACGNWEAADLGWSFGTALSYALVTGAADSDATAVGAGAVTDLSVEYQ